MAKKIVNLTELQRELKRAELPSELVAQLSTGNRRYRITDKIMNWAQEHGKAFSIDDALIALYELDGRVKKRVCVSNALHRLQKRGRLIRTGVGTYQVK